jgi:hypothetical protein
MIRQVSRHVSSFAVLNLRAKLSWKTMTENENAVGLTVTEQVSGRARNGMIQPRPGCYDLQHLILESEEI